MEKIAFLNGDLGFHDYAHKKYFNKLNSQGKYVMLLDNLFNEPENVFRIARYDTVVLGSTGFHMDKIESLFQKMKELKKLPTTVIFAPDEDPFVGMAFQMKGTKFYCLDYTTLEPYPLDYLNK